MPGIDQEQAPADRDSDLRRMQQRLIDETVDDSFPASDPPAWTTAGSASIAAQAETGSRAQTGDGRWREQAGDFAGHQGQAQALRPKLLRSSDALMGSVERYPLAALALAGAVGYAVAWLMHGRGSTERSIPPYGRRASSGARADRMSPAERRRAEAHLARSSHAAGSAGATPDSY